MFALIDLKTCHCQATPHAPGCSPEVSLVEHIKHFEIILEINCHNQNRAQPFMLQHIVTDCEMLYLIFFDFLDSPISLKLLLHTSQARKEEQ